MEDLPQLKADKTMPVAWQHNKNLPDCMIELYDKSLWTDVRFHCKGPNEDKIIHAHKIVLAARSPVFQAMFFGPCANGKDEVELDNSDSEILDLVLRYIYNDRVTLSGENAASVLEMAHYYQVTSLVQFCADYLSTIITPANACETLSLVMQYELTTLCDACCAFIDKHAEEVLNSDGFLELSDSCLTYILKGDTFYANEDIIFKKSEEWAKRKLDERKQVINGPNTRLTLGESFYYLRLPAMTFETFTKCIHKKGYFSAEEYEDLSEFINKIPESSVRSNSCVARLSTDATVTVNEEEGEPKLSDTITTRFQIAVSRKVKLTNFIVSDIRYCHVFKKNYYTDENCPAITNNAQYISDLQNKYSKKVLRLNHSYGITTIQELKTIKEEDDLSDKIDIVLSGILRVTCKNRDIASRDDNKDMAEKIELENEHVNVPEEMISENDKNKDLIFEQTFELKSSDLSQRKINLREPFILTKTQSPYEVEISIKYNSECGVKMKTLCSNNKTVRCENGELFIQDIEGRFAGIKSLGFENVSNRENDKE